MAQSFLKFIFSVLVLAQFSWGYSYVDNRNLYPLGEKELFMANTGIAMTQSSGSAFYNPAGLATIEANKLSLSSNTYFTAKSDFSSLQTIDDKKMPFSTSGSQSIPSSLISTWKGEKLTTAFSIFVPHQMKVQESALFSSNNYEAIQMTRSQSFQVLMAGGSVAGKLNDSWRLGASCFYTSYQTSQQFDLAVAPRDPNALRPVVANTFFNADISGLLCHLGAQTDYNDFVTLGFTIKSPLMITSKKGTASKFVIDVNGNSQADGAKNVETQFEIPSEIGAGIKLNLADRFKFFGDVNYQMSGVYKDGNLLSEKFEHKGTMRFNGGLQFKISQKNDLLAGFSYNPTSLKAPKAEPQENFFVGTLGIQTQSENSILGIGLFIAQSYGEMEVSNYDVNFQELGTYKSDVKTAISGILLSSGFSF